MSMQLHSALCQSGFVEARAALQSATADVLQEIIRRGKPELGYDSLFVVGSFSEGWGNSLAKLDGRTDVESDIDVTEFIPGRMHHLRGYCRCPGIRLGDTNEYLNGHILHEGSASSPASPEAGSVLRPAVDQVLACRLCCYPDIAPLLPDRVARSNIPSLVLQSLEQELSSSPCHVVHAAAPGQAGKQLRVSTTFLEKRLLRSLTTLQGQLFVTLKYLVKKVISRRVQGIKAYHVKTVTFRILEETPVQEWCPENLVSLVRKSLQMLLDGVESTSDKPDGRVLDHFFLCDAGLYFKGDDQKSAEEIAAVLTDVISQLPRLLMQFKASLKPLAESDMFNFHPLHVLPYLSTYNSRTKIVSLHASSALESEPSRFQEIYNIVRESWRLLAGELHEQAQRSLLSDMIDRLPECARTARETLRAMAYLKLGHRGEAVKVLTAYRSNQVSRGIPWPPDKRKVEATNKFVWHYLANRDSAWKFCLWFGSPPELSFLPAFPAACFPSQMINYGGCFYLNFDALLTCLRWEILGPGVAPEVSDWCQSLLDRCEEADPQEVMVALHYCSDSRQLQRLLRTCGRVVFTDQVKRKAQDMLMLENAPLRESFMRATIAEIEALLSSRNIIG